MRPARRLFPAALWLLAALCCTAPASAKSSSKSDASWGVFPALRWGLTFPGSEGTRGWLLEGAAEGLYLFPGDRLGVALGLGYVLNQVGPVAGARTGTGVELDGWTVTPKVVFGLAPSLWVEGFAGLLLGDLGSVGELAPVSATGWRAGGGLVWNMVHLGSSDVALHLELMHTRASAATMPDYAATSVSLCFTFSFFSELSD